MIKQHLLVWNVSLTIDVDHEDTWLKYLLDEYLKIRQKSDEMSVEEFAKEWKKISKKLDQIESILVKEYNATRTKPLIDNKFDSALRSAKNNERKK